MGRTMTETGKIEWFDPGKGYGFIKRETGEDVFFHHSHVAPSETRPRLKSGEEVEFVVDKDHRGRAHAHSVRVVEQGVAQ